jgi:hypothetical protein
MNKTIHLTNTSRRFVNHFFINMVCHFISINNNLKFEYSYFDDFQKLGIDFYIGEKTYDSSIELSDSNFFFYIDKVFHKNITFHPSIYFQTKEFAFYLKNYIYQPTQQVNIISHNPFKERYNNNNDVFIHIRLGDSVKNNPGFLYYDNLLSKLSFDKGYISSDSIQHPICSSLISKFNLHIIDDNVVPTIQFGSTCKHIILSNGTFSWFIGLLGFYSTVYYPKIKNIWHGDIFVFPEWNEIDASDSYAFKEKIKQQLLKGFL